MSTEQHPWRISDAYAGSITLGPRLATYVISESWSGDPEAEQKEWHDRLRSLEQWICELLIKNQQLRMALESATLPDKEKQDD